MNTETEQPTIADKPRRDLSAAHEGRRRAALSRRLSKMIAELERNGYTVVPPRS